MAEPPSVFCLSHSDLILQAEAEHQIYASIVFSFSFRPSGQTLFSGDHYQALSQFLVPGVTKPLQSDSEDNHKSTFVIVHEHKNNGRRKHIHEFVSFDAFDSHWSGIQGNRILFLRGYPSAEWLCRLGGYLNLDYEFLHQHFSNSHQLCVSESYCLPPLSLVSTGTIQLTFTTIGLWDNHRSGIDLTTARAVFCREMKAFVKDLNSGQGFQTCHSIVRKFHLHDLKHFSIEQTVTIKLLQGSEHWTRKSYILSQPHPRK